MALWEVELDNGEKYQVESDTEPTADDVRSYLADSANSDVEGVSEDLWKAEKQAQIDEGVGTLRAIADNVAAMGYSLGNTVGMGIPGWVASKVAGKESSEAIDAFLEKNKAGETVGEVAGFLTPTGAPAQAVKLGLKAGKLAGKLVPGAGKASDLTRFALKSGAIAAASETEYELQKTFERAAGTRDWNTEQSAAEEVWENGKLNFALQVGLGVLGKGASKIAGLVSNQAKAIKVAGGKENLLKAQSNYRRAISAGASDAEASNVFMASLSQGLSEQDRLIFEHLIEHNEEFARFMRNQMAGAGQLVTNTISALTRPEYGKYARGILKGLYGENYRNFAGSTDIDYSVNGIKQLLGTDNPQKALKMRGEGLARAEAKLMQDPSLASSVKNEFRGLVDDLMQSGSKDYEAALSKIEPADIKSFVGSEAEAAARENLAQQISAFQTANGVPPTAEMVSQLERQIMRQGARQHMNKLMTAGTDSVQDINDIKEFMKRVNEAQVVEGQSAAIGRFNEGVNSRILDQLDSALWETNQALRYEKKLMDMHKFGNNFEPAKMSELNALLYNGTSAEEAAVKLAAFKMGYLNKMTEAAINGDRAGFNAMREIVRSKRGLGQYFEPGELSEYFEQLKPKIEASVNIKKLVRATEGFAGEPDMTANATRFVLGSVTNSRNTAANAAISWLQKAKYGPGTAKRIMQFAENPSAENFNIMFSKTQDFLEKTQLTRAFLDSVKQEAVAQQAFIRQAIGD